MSLPIVSEDIIYSNAVPKSFSRGEAYYNAGAVSLLTQRGDSIQSRVEGSDLEPYRVKVQFDAKGIPSATCPCPYEYEGWCKYIVATLLMCAHQPEAIEARPTLSQLLDRLDQVETQRLVQELADEQPDLIEAIDRHMTLITASTPPPQPTQVPRQTAIDPAPFRRQVRQIIRRKPIAIMKQSNG